MKVDGRCHCGEIVFEAEIDPAKVVICHCSDCQNLSGGAFRVFAPTTPGGFRLLRGAPKTYVKLADSGNRREQAFCDACGSSIYSTPPGPPPKIVALRVGTLTQRAELKPSRQIWRSSAMPWLDALHGIDGLDTQPEFSADGRIGPD